MRPQRNQRILDECENRLSNDDVQRFHQSKHVFKVKALLEDITDEKIFTERDICEARDYLLTLITLRTGTRPGALEHMRLSQ